MTVLERGTSFGKTDQSMFTGGSNCSIYKTKYFLSIILFHFPLPLVLKQFTSVSSSSFKTERHCLGIIMTKMINLTLQFGGSKKRRICVKQFEELSFLYTKLQSLNFSNLEKMLHK